MPHTNLRGVLAGNLGLEQPLQALCNWIPGRAFLFKYEVSLHYRQFLFEQLSVAFGGCSVLHACQVESHSSHIKFPKGLMNKMSGSKSGWS